MSPTPRGNSNPSGSWWTVGLLMASVGVGGAAVLGLLVARVLVLGLGDALVAVLRAFR